MSPESHDIRFINSFQPLLYKTLSRLNIPQSNSDFEDYVQELTVHLLTLRDTFEQDIFQSDKNRFKFTAYASKGLYWFGLNLIRDNNKENSYASTTDDIEYYAKKYNTERLNDSNLFIADFYMHAQKRLSDEDYRLLLYISEDVYTSSEIASFMGISRSTVYDRLRKIQLRLNDLRECLLE